MIAEEHKIFDSIPDVLSQSGAPWTDTVTRTMDVTVFKDAYPCTPGHLLFVPNFNTMTGLERAFSAAAEYGKLQVQSGAWDGFNIGMNYGEAAGQTVKWPHVHLIPRRQGDVEDPVGGVRNTIPGKGNYKLKTSVV